MIEDVFNVNKGIVLMSYLTIGSKILEATSVLDISLVCPRTK